MKLLLVIVLSLMALQLRSQDIEDKFVVVTIEKETDSKLHKRETDYWIVSLKLWEKSPEEAVLPLYLVGFSSTDFKECCTDKSLILFNSTTEETFEFAEDFKNDQNTLIKLIAKERKRVQTIKKKWVTGYKERVTIYLTPINGKFCLCSVVHKDGGSKLGYEGQAAMPVSGFSYDSTFWSSKEARQIERFDYADLPFIALQNIQ